MRWIILALAFGVVGSQQLQYEPFFNPKKVYLYQYQGVILTGLPEKGLTKGGLKLTSKVEIRAKGQRTYVLKILSPEIQEFSGSWPDEEFIPSWKLTRKLTPQLTQPVEFEYNRGRVGNLFAPRGISENILNIHRGILNMFQISIKRNQNIYELQENGLEGVCHTSYTIQEDKKAKHIIITKSKDLNACEEKISESKGSDYSQRCKTCQMKGKNLRSVSTYTYILTSAEQGAEVAEVVSKESHQFTPFNELDGAASTDSRQHLSLLELKNESLPMPSNSMEKRGGLKFQFSNELMQMPMQFVKPSYSDSKVTKMLEELVQKNKVKAHPDAPQMFLHLSQLLHSANLANLQNLWEKNANKQSSRQWILDSISITATQDAIRFIQNKIEQDKLSQFEAAQALFFVLHSIKPDCHGVDNATELLSSSYMNKNPFLRKITLLSYGSLVQKYCSRVQVCPDQAIKPIHDLVVEAGNRGHEEEIILGLKAIGNAGQPASLKRIQKLLPGFSSSANGVSNRVQMEAVMALRNIGKKEPHKVQNIAMQLLMNKKNRAQMRIRAFIVLMETKPSMALVATVTDSLIRDTNLHLTSFAYSYMKSLSGTLVPEQHSLAAVFNVAVKRLSQKCDTLSYQYSKGIHFGLFSDRFLAGIDTNLYLLKKLDGILPTSAIANFRYYGLGALMDSLEVGIQVEGIQQALSKSKPAFWKGPKKNSMEQILKKVSDWKSMPAIKPLVSVYIKLFGQEITFVELNQNDIQEIMKMISNQGKLDGLFRKFINTLQRGISIKCTKSLLVSELRHLVPTSLGLPLELAFYYTTVSAVQAHAKATFTPPLSNTTLSHVLNRTIHLESQLTASSVKDVKGIMGINSPMIQTGVEIQLKISTVIPLNFTARISYKKRNIKIESPPLQQEIQLFSVSTQAFAYSRNVEEPARKNIFPLLPSEESVLRIKALRLAKNSTVNRKVMDKVLPLAIVPGSVCSAEELPDTLSQSVYRICTTAKTFGFEVCYDASAENSDFPTNSPLYEMIGKKALDITIRPVPTDVPIKKFQIELQMDESLTRVNHRLMRSNWTHADSSEKMQAEGKLVLLKLRKILQPKRQHQQERREHKYTLSSSMSSSQTSSRSSRRRSEQDKVEYSRTRGIHSLKSGSRDKKHGSRDRRGKHKLEEHSKPRHYSTSSSQSSSRMRSSKEHYNKHLRNYGMHSPVNRQEPKRNKYGRHQKLGQERRHDTPGRRVPSEDEHHTTVHLSSSSSPGLSKERLSRHSSFRKSRGHRVSSSASALNSGHRRVSTQSPLYQGSTKRCHSSSCRGEKFGRPSIRNSSLSSTDSLSLSSSVTSSAQSEEGHGDLVRDSSSTSSSSSEPSSSVSSSAESKRQHSRQTAHGQSSSSVRGDSTTDSSSARSDTVDAWPTSTYQTGSERMCKNGRCIYTKRKTFSATTHKTKEHHFVWISDSKPWKESQNKQLRSFETSFDTTMSFSSSASSSSSNSLEQSTFLGGLMPPILTLFTRAITTDNEEKGYQTRFFADNLMDIRLWQVVVDEIQDGGKWKVCINAELPYDRLALGTLRWGQDCQDYKIAGKASMGHVKIHPAVLLKAKWGRLPQSLKDTAQVIGDQLARILFLMGFSQRHIKGTPRQISAILAATSQRTFDIMIKDSKHVYSRTALLIPASLPFDVKSPSKQPKGFHFLPYLPVMFSSTSTAECTVVQDMVTPFSENSFKYKMPEGCSHILVQDCTSDMKFVVLITRYAESLTLQMNLHYSIIKIESTTTGDLQLTIDENKVPIESLPVSLKSLSIEQTDNGLKIKDPELGLESLFFDGKMIKVATMPSIIGTTCGLCGQGSIQGSNEYQQPNRRKTKEVLKFTHSWLIPRERCNDTCKLIKQHVKLDEPVKILGKDVQCYSTEPIVDCDRGCSRFKTVPINYSFHCIPIDSHTSPTDEQLKSATFAQKSEDVTIPFDVPVECSCSSECK
ncbi:vitellogenin-like [Hemitrygon akajei]|uniref:vitellogenin-like n=1 Tax=Hemitrygon akajei TaxID=2704970 RepID=UPI003BFA041B